MYVITTTAVLISALELAQNAYLHFLALAGAVLTTLEASLLALYCYTAIYMHLLYCSYCYTNRYR